MYIQKALMILSKLLFMTACFLSGAVSVDLLVVAYVCLMLSTAIVMVVVIGGLDHIRQTESAVKFTLNALYYLGPFLIMLALCGFLTITVIKNRSVIISGDVSDNYETFRTISAVLFISKLLILYNALNSKFFEERKKITNATNSLLYLLCVLNFICTIIIFVILSYYSTDG